MRENRNSSGSVGLVAGSILFFIYSSSSRPLPQQETLIYQNWPPLLHSDQNQQSRVHLHSSFYSLLSNNPPEQSSSVGRHTSTSSPTTPAILSDLVKRSPVEVVQCMGFADLGFFFKVKKL